ncbi:MAG: AAA family ATPase, partial [Candidatus Njordarchaeota archaeon]
PNASGKTNVIEAFKLFLKIISLETKYINPFLEWWGYQNVVWRGREELPIILGFEIDLGKYKGFYEIYVTGIGGEFRILRENIILEDIVEVIHEGGTVTVKHSPSYIEKIWSKIEKNIELYKEKVLIQKETIPIDDTSLLFSRWSSRVVDDIAIVTPSLPEESSLKIVSPSISTASNTSLRSPWVTPLVSAIAPPIQQNDIIILRQLAFREIRTPQPFKKETILAEDAVNIANIFHTLYINNNGTPKRIKAAINTIFGESTIIKPEVTEDGRVYVKVIENNLELRPSMIADGFWKVLAIMIAIEAKPKLIIIDELENSLHPEAIEYIVNELKNSGSTIIATTHSPAVVDTVKPEDLILVEKDIEGNTILRRVPNIDRVKAWLTQHGITLSEGWLYGEIFSEQ